MIYFYNLITFFRDRGLKKLMREIVYLTVRITLLPFLLRRTIQKNAVTILTFHNIEYNTARLLFAFIKKEYTPIALSQYIDILYNQNSSIVPQRGMIITLDDGYKENYRLLPLAKENNIVPTIFICSSVVDTNHKLWFNIIRNKRQKRKLKKIADEDRVKICSAWQKEMKDKLQARVFLNHSEMIEMRNYFEFQSHTITHPILSKCSKEKSREEISLSKKVLEDKFGFVISALAFPNGSYTSREVDYLKQAGYKCGLTLNFHYNTSKSDPFQVSRIPLNDDAGINEIVVKASGLYDLLIKRIFPIRHY